MDILSDMMPLIKDEIKCQENSNQALIIHKNLPEKQDALNKRYTEKEKDTDNISRNKAYKSLNVNHHAILP